MGRRDSMMRPWMTRTIALALMLTLTAAVTLALPWAALAVSSETLIEENKVYDGRTVTFKGEVIGDVLRRGGHAWINVNDDAYAMEKNVLDSSELKGYNSGQAIYLPESLTKQIKHVGDYNTRGDIVSVTGVFHRAAVDHGGDMMIEGRTLTVISHGSSIEHRPGTLELPLLLILGVLAAGYAIASYKPSST